MKRKSRKLKSKPQPQSESEKEKEWEGKRLSSQVLSECAWWQSMWVDVCVCERVKGDVCGRVCVCVYHDNLLKAQPFVHTTTQSILNFRLPHLYLLLFFAQRRVQGRAKRGGWGSQRSRRRGLTYIYRGSGMWCASKSATNFQRAILLYLYAIHTQTRTRIDKHTDTHTHSRTHTKLRLETHS